MSDDPRYCFAVARLAACNRHPYLSTAYMALTLVDSAHLPPNVIGTMGCDKRWRLYASPDVWDKWTVEQQAAVLYHEIGHLLRAHHARMETYAMEHPYLTNVAQDCELNDDIIAEGVPLPQFPPCPKCKCNGGPVTPKMFGLQDGQLAETYYQALLKHRLNCPCECHQGGAGDGFPNDARPGAGACGSAATGKQMPWELPDDGGSTGEKGVSEARGDLIRQEVAQKIRDTAKQAGTVPLGLQQWADSFLSPKVNWRKELAASVRRALADVAGQMDFSYRHLSRRDGGGIIFPAMRKPVPEIAIVADTSGSMGGELDDLMAEVGGILKATVHNNGCPVLCTDAEVQWARRVFRPQQVELLGGGGTNLVRGLEAASRLKPKPHVCVVITDCYTPWGDSNFGMKVIVAAIGEGGDRPSWPHKYIQVED